MEIIKAEHLGFCNGVKRAIKIFATIAKAMIKAVVVPNSVNAIETIASLFGTTPDTLNASWNICPNGINAPCKIVEPPVKTKKPKHVLNVPLITSVAGFLSNKRPIKAINATSIDGSLRTSTIKSRIALPIGNSSFNSHDAINEFLALN